MDYDADQICTITLQSGDAHLMIPRLITESLLRTDQSN